LPRADNRRQREWMVNRRLSALAWMTEGARADQRPTSASRLATVSGDDSGTAEEGTVIAREL
jgi:hypothetical protein